MEGKEGNRGGISIVKKRDSITEREEAAQLKETKVNMKDESD